MQIDAGGCGWVQVDAEGHRTEMSEEDRTSDDTQPSAKQTSRSRRSPSSASGTRRVSGKAATDALSALSALSDPLERARRAYTQRRWQLAYTSFASTDHTNPLALDDLELYAIATRLVNREEESVEVFTRVHHAAMDAGDRKRGIRAAAWLALYLHFSGERARGAGWLARSRRFLSEESEECVESGYHLMALALQCVSSRDIVGAADAFEHAMRIGEKFRDRDLVTRANQGRARTLINMGDTSAGSALLDEVLVAVTAAEVSPLAVGDLYCSAIAACYEMFDMRRAREWTGALARWCDAEPELALYRGQCQIRRAEVLQLNGEWSDALAEAANARESMAAPPPDRSIGAAHYRIGELRRLRGDAKGAEQAYRSANEAGHSAIPGLALLRLSEGEIATAIGALARALEEMRDKRSRARVLAAYIDVLVAAGDTVTAERAVLELEELASHFDSVYLRATAMAARAQLLLATDDARQALPLLRSAFDTWRELEAPYEEGRTRLLLARACRALGDVEGAQLELDAAWSIFRRLGAMPDLTIAEQLGARPTTARARTRDDNLTEREQEVLALLATGMTNRALAAELKIAEKTVARHVSNIFMKLGVTTRAAATAYALRHDE